MGKVGPVVCVGFVLGRTHVCILMGEVSFFPLRWAGLCDMICFGYLWEACLLIFFVLFIVSVRRLALGAVGSWVTPGLGYR